MINPPIQIIGAGPVGLLLACLLGKRDLEVTVYEKRTELPRCSMAIGITPPSLEIFEQLDLKNEFLRRGVLIPRAKVYENQRHCGSLDFRRSGEEILSFPQFGTLQLLRQRLTEFPNVHLHEGVEMQPGRIQSLRGLVIACDGADSPVREHLRIPVRRKSYGVRFVMADFPDHENLGPDARLYFSPRGAVESFPLPDRRRRWIAQCVPPAEQNHDTLLQRVHDAVGIGLHDREHGPVSPFDPYWALAEHYVQDRVILCGDAAHVMSPIGGQGMNTGFADALHLSRILPDPSPDALRAYTRQRQQAFRIAARRAAMGMYLGTRTGTAAGACRAALLRFALREPHLHRTLARTFAMRNLPRAHPS